MIRLPLQTTKLKCTEGKLYSEEMEAAHDAGVKLQDEIILAGALQTAEGESAAESQKTYDAKANLDQIIKDIENRKAAVAAAKK